MDIWHNITRNYRIYEYIGYYHEYESMYLLVFEIYITLITGAGRINLIITEGMLASNEVYRLLLSLPIS